MAECISLVFAVTSLVIQLGELHRTKPADIRYLLQDLETFKERLSLSKNILPLNHHLWMSCEELVIDIEVLLSTHANRRPWQQAMTLSSREISSLRERLKFQMEALPGRHVFQRDFFDITSQSSSEFTEAANDIQDITPVSARSRAIEVPTLSSTDQAITDHTKIPYLPSSRSTSSGLSSAIDRISSTFSLASDITASDLFSLHSSGRNSSTYTTETELSLLSNDIEPYQNSDYINAANLKPGIIRRYACRPVVADLGNTIEHINVLPQRTPLIWAIIDGSTEELSLILETKAELLEQRDGEWDWTPLIWAIMEDRPAMLELLLETGANVLTTDFNTNRTPLLWAASIGHTEIIDKLLRKNPDLVHAVDKAGMTPLALAFNAGYTETAECLLRAGHTPDCHLSCGESLLPLSIVARDVEFAHLLLKNGASPRVTDVTGLPVLIIAIQVNLPSVVGALIARGADVQCTDDQGVPALTLAIKHECRAIAHLLLNSGADLHLEDNNGCTALLWAIWCSDEELVTALVHRGAQTAVVDGEGVSAQSWAVQTGNQKIVQAVCSNP